MDTKTQNRKMRWWIPIFLIILLVATVGWLEVTQSVARQLVSLLLIPLGLLLLSLWYIFFTQLPWPRRWKLFGLWIVLVAGSSVAIAKLTRWEGSMDGSAIPRLVWKNAVKADKKLAALAPSGATATMEDSTASFPQFLGPLRNGSLPDLQLDPDWKTHPPEELWRIPIGAGWSGFSVSAGRAVTQEQRGPMELISCYDLATGAPLWVHQNEVRFSENMGGDGPRATPTIHEGRVYAIGATGILDCLDLKSGEPIWSQDVLSSHSSENLQYGIAGSPLIVNGSPDLVVVTGGSGGPSLLAYDLLSGDPVWTAGKDKPAYASPVLTTLAGRQQIVTMNTNTVTGHDPVTGTILWSYDWPSNAPKASLTQPLGNNRLLLTASYGKGSAVIEISAGDGPNQFVASRIWKGLQMKTKFSNVSISNGHAYGLDEGRLACIELTKGKRQWKGDNYGYGQNLQVGDHLLIQAEHGDVALVELNPKQFKEVARIEALNGKTWNNPALAGQFLLVRNDQEAICFRIQLR